MTTERIKRRIERLLDQVEEAADAEDWETVQRLSLQVLDMDEDNVDAQTFAKMAERSLGAAPSPAAPTPYTVEPPTSTKAPRASEAPALPTPPVQRETPTSFSDGRYEVKRFLGEGGKKMVYLAHDNLLDRDVAFALIKTEGLDVIGLTRINREAQAMGRLGSHPHIVTVFDLGDHDGQPFMVTELMGGGDVEGILEDAAEHRVPLEQAVSIASETCRGLEFAHSKGIVHRDLKPGNVWLTSDGVAKIGDFGLAVASDRSRLTQEGMMVGTVSYMPPEQAMGGEVTQRADLYSLGAMLYEMVTGRPPFLGDDSVSIIGQHINTPPVSPTWHNGNCPRPLEALILRLLAKNPEERPGSASDVLMVLDGLGTEVSLEAPAVVGAETAEDRTNALDSVAQGVFVGRQQEMGDLKAGLEDVLSGRGRMMTLVGEPGIGKTRTSQELATYAGLRGAKVLWGRCYEEQGVPPYWPWVQAIRSYVRDTEPEKLSTEMGAGAADIAEVVSDVKTQLPGLQPAPQLEPEQARFRLFDSITAFLRSASEARPLVVVLDDLHWADKPSLLLLQFVVREIANSRLMIIGTYRDMELSRQHPLAESLGELTRERAFQRVLLRGLSQEDVERFVEVAAGVRADTGLVNAVYTQTEGNPLFVTEVVRLLVQEGQLGQNAGTMSSAGRQTESWTVRIPEGVREVIGRRLNRMSERCNDTLTIASIVGREFEFSQLKALVEDLSEDMLLDVLEEALAARVIEEMPDSIGRYQFTHALLQETLMDELSLTRRVRLHARIAESLEATYGEDSEAHAAELAFHFEQAQSMVGTDKLVRYSMVAGQKALDNSAFEDAMAHFQRGVDARQGQDMDDQLAELLVGYGRAGCSLGNGLRTTEEFVPAMERAFGHYVTTGQTDNAVAVADFPHSTLVQNLMKETHRRALKLVKEGSHQAARILSLYGYSLGAATGSDLTQSRDAFERALEIVRREGDEALEVRILSSYANILSFHLQWEEALPMAAEAIDREDESNNPVDILRALLWVSQGATSTGEFKQGEETADNMLARARVTRDHYWIARAMNAMMDAVSAQGRFDEALAMVAEADSMGLSEPSMNAIAINVLSQVGRFDDAQSLITSMGETPLIAKAYYLELGKDEAMAHALEEATAEDARQTFLSVSPTTPIFHMRVRYGLSILANLKKDPAVAAEEYQQIISLVGDANGAYLTRSNQRVLGDLAKTSGDEPEAEDHYQRSVEFCRETGFKPELAWSMYEYADLLLTRGGDGDREKAGPMLDETLALATDMGMKPLMEKVLSKREILKA